MDSIVFVKNLEEFKKFFKYQKNLVNLTFGDFFNKKIKKDILPNNLTNLTFGFYFNQEI